MDRGTALYLGRVGSTGTSTGAHAHWEVLKDGKRFPLSKARSDIGQYLQFRLPNKEEWNSLYSRQGNDFVLHPSAALTSPMGMRKHPVYGDMREHRGEDYGLPEGTQLRFLGTGSVATHAGRGGAGNVSSLRTGPYELQTFHLSELPQASKIKEQQIQQAQQGTGPGTVDAGNFLQGFIAASLLRPEQKTAKTSLKEELVRGLLQQDPSQDVLSSLLGGNPLMVNPYLG